jgi:hypothetical protein
VFLLIGYGAWLEELLVRRRGADAPAGLPAWLAGALVALPLLTAGAVSARHVGFQRGAAAVASVAGAAADERGGTLGLTDSAAKVGLLYGGRTTLFDAHENRTAVVLCNELSASHRAGDDRHSCALPGYRAIASGAGMVALVRDDAAP